MDATAASDPTDKPWERAWTTEEMRENRADWNLAGDSGLLKHLQQFSDKLMTRADKTQEALNTLTSELDETIIFIDNITNTSSALANTQFIESRVCEDEVDAATPQEERVEAQKTRDQLDAELIASIGESVRRGIAIMEDKYETLEVVASDSEDDGEIPIPSVILRPKDPYQDRPLPYIIGSERWKNSSKIGLETSSSESDHPEEDDSESDSDDDIGPVSKPINLQNRRIARLSSSSSESNDFNAENNFTRHVDDTGSNRNQDIFDSESDITTAANSLPKNSTGAAPNFAEELAKRLGSVAPPHKSVNIGVADEPVVIANKDDLFTPEDDDLFSTPSKNLFNEPAGLFDEESSNSLWNDKPSKPFKSAVLPPSLDVPPPINNVSTKPKSALDDLFGDADSEDSDDIFSGKSSMNQKNLPNTNLRAEEKMKTNNLLSVGGATGKIGMTTSTPETNDVTNSIFDDESEDADSLFGRKPKQNDWTQAKASIPDKTAGSTPAEASKANNRKKPVGGVSILGQIDIFASGKLRRQASSDSSSSKSSSSDFESSRSRVTNANDDNNTNSVTNTNSANGNSVLVAPNMQSGESSGISLQPPSIDNITAGSNISPEFQPQMTSTWNKTGDMYRERIASDSLFNAKTIDRGNENSLNNARIDEVPDVPNDDTFEDTDEIFGPPPLPKTGSKSGSKSKVASLFDDSDSGDDLFSNTSSGSRSQKSADLLSTTTQPAATSQSSEKQKVVRKNVLFDDEDEEGDIFGSKDSSEVNLFAAKTLVKDKKSSEIVKEATAGSVKEKKSNESSSFVRESLENSFEKQNTVKISQTAPIAKLGSIFDDLDDDDLFSPSFGKKSSAGQKAAAPSLFDDGAEDLFAVPAKSAVGKLEKTVKSSSSEVSEDFSESARVKSETRSGGKVKSKVMEQLAAKLDAVKAEEKTESKESKGENERKVVEKYVKSEMNVEENLAQSELEKSDIFSVNKSKNLASKILDEMKIVQKSKMGPEAKPGIAKKPEILKKPDVAKKSEIRKDSSVRVASKTTKIKSESVEETQEISEESSVKSFGSVERIVSSSEEESSSKTSKSENVFACRDTSSNSSKTDEITTTSAKREPPNTLEIRSSTSSITSEKSSAVQRRVVSGKIANLMGRMSDLKILSPTDTPPVLRKNEERTDEEGDKDSEDGSGFSTSKESPTLSEELPKIVAPPSPTETKELEPAISFDQPVQVETLSVTAYKSRVRIQSKRRPQSRHARQNALRKSGIDFDTVDLSNDNNSDMNRNLLSNSSNNNSSSTENSTNAQNIANSNTDRLIISTGSSESVSVKVTESSSSTFFDDRSEISFSKESSLSVNKNTLLSPSTDEEDLFDVPPDLPEDPPKEDALFGRAPILSPVESFVKVKKDAKHESYKSEKRKDGFKEETRISAKLVTKESSQTDTKEDVFETEVSVTDKSVSGNEVRNENTDVEKLSIVDKLAKVPSSQDTSGSESKRREEGEEEMSDPLRDSSHDPLKDPSNLFAFVTKTPSPEKGKTLFNEDDDSLFSSSFLKGRKDSKVEEKVSKVKTSSAERKQTLDLFADDPDVDFFKTSLLPKSARKSNEDSKIDLFGDDTQDDDLFGSGNKKSSFKSDVTSSRSVATEEMIAEVQSSSRKQSLFSESSTKKLFESSKTIGSETKLESTKKATASSGLFSDDDGSDIFTTRGKVKSEKVSSGTKKTVKDIFGGQSSEEEDMFSTKTTVFQKSTISSGLFGEDDDDDDEDAGNIFGKSASSSSVKSKSVETRGVVKKAATRDLRKTAEKIVEDPLSMLQKE